MKSGNIHALSFTDGFLLGLFNVGVKICPGWGVKNKGLWLPFRPGMSCIVIIVAAGLLVIMQIS